MRVIPLSWFPMELIPKAVLGVHRGEKQDNVPDGTVNRTYYFLVPFLVPAPPPNPDRLCRFFTFHFGLDAHSGPQNNLRPAPFPGDVGCLLLWLYGIARFFVFRKKDGRAVLKKSVLVVY